ncbi:MAG: polysaccharide biosynthesis C-terminal domain-containing protein, partial [Candidatus Saccharibacteria bacterium]|nr:polysaccharide biosynthesis C-terminal domain-containing protein [Candidatus Saccharibacteria bacterium]
LTVLNVMAINLPTFSRVQHKPDILAKGLELSLFFITLFIFPIIIGMAVFIHPLLSVFADQYGKWMPAAMSFALFSLSIGWSAVSTPLTNLLNAVGKINQTLKLMIGWTVLTWVLTPPLIWFFGYNGVALAALLISFTSIAAVFMVKRELPFKLLPNVGPQLLAASMMGIVGLVGRSYWSMSLPHLVSGTIITAGVYFVLVTLLARERLITNVQYIVRRRK